MTRLVAILAMTMLASCASLPRMPTFSSPFPARTTVSAEAQLLEVDRAFNDFAQSDGVQAAFVRFADPADAMLVRPGAVFQGASQIQAAFDGAPAGARLTWSPDQAFVARAGDLGMTTGRFTSTLDRKEVDQGRYVTVWRKDSKGYWRLLADVGASDPARSGSSPTRIGAISGQPTNGTPAPRRPVGPTDLLGAPEADYPDAGGYGAPTAPQPPAPVRTRPLIIPSRR